MFDVDFTEPPPAPELTPAQEYTKKEAAIAQQRLSDDETFYTQRYNNMWQGHDIDPQGVVDRFAAMGPGGKRALTALAIQIGALIQVFSLFPGTKEIVARLQGLVAKPGWKIVDNGDGTMSATPPKE